MSLTLPDVLENMNNSEKREVLQNYLYRNYCQNKESPRISLFNGSDIILHVDSGLNLREQGYEVALGIKNSGLGFARILELSGFSYSEIDYSCYKRKMEEPIIEEGYFSRLTGKRVLAVDMDIVTGNTFDRVAAYLTGRGINLGGIYVGFPEHYVSEFSESRINELDLRKIRGRKTPPAKEFEQNGLPIFSYTNPEFLVDATRRVFEYFQVRDDKIKRYLDSMEQKRQEQLEALEQWRNESRNFK